MYRELIKNQRSNKMEVTLLEIYSFLKGYFIIRLNGLDFWEKGGQIKGLVWYILGNRHSF